MLRAMRKAALLLVCAMAAGCVAAGRPDAPALEETLIPSTIGVIVRRVPVGLVIAAVGNDSPAATAGLRVGDLVVNYNGIPVAEVRQFNRLVLQSAAGTVARLEVVRDGATRRFDVPVEQVDTTLRV
jgi:S1-C subfamily serine protease